MNHHVHHVLPILLACAARAALAECPVTLPSSSPVDVPGMKSGTAHAWYGSDALAVSIPTDGRWKGMGSEHHFRDKFWIWRRGYDAETETRPALTIVGLKLSGGEPQRLNVERATNALGKGWSSMLALVEFPSEGCWRVTVTYVYVGITQELPFVVDVVGD